MAGNGYCVGCAGQANVLCTERAGLPAGGEGAARIAAYLQVRMQMAGMLRTMTESKSYAIIAC